MAWYALFVITGKEESVSKWLQVFLPELEISTLIPQRKLFERRQGKTEQVLKKMFPGYVLVNIEMNFRIYYILKKIPDLIRILDSGDYYSRISDEEMTHILRLLGEGDVVDCSQVYLVNSRVVVKSGPLEGMEGMIRAVDRRKLRAKIALQFLGQEREIDLGIDFIEQCHDVSIASQ